MSQYGIISIRNIVFLCFFISGATGLIFENLWIRMLTLVFGSTTLAISSVLTSFMGGLALGSYFFGKKADEIKRPMRLYAVMEGAVGVWAILSLTAVQNLYPHLNRWLWATFQPEYISFSLLRFIFTILLILPPATLMGGTLPILSRMIVKTQREYSNVGSKAGWLYAFNTFGAIAGAAAGGFILMPGIGVVWTNTLAAFLNIFLIMALILLLEKRITGSFFAHRRDIDELEEAMKPGVKADTGPDEPPAPCAPPEPVGARGAVAVLIAFGISGFASMNYQVIWSRAMSMIIGSSIYAFTITLAAFLCGIAIGSAVISATIGRIRRPILWVAGVQMWIAVAAVAIYFVMDHFPYWFASMVTSVGIYHNHIGLIQLFMFITAFLATVPAALGMGATFPLTIRVCCGSLERVGTDIGKIYAVNTIGAIAGSFASAFILVPVFSRIGYGYGLQWSFLLSVALNIGAFVLVLSFARVRRTVRVAAAGLVPLALGVLVLATIAGRLYWDPARMTIGPFRVSLADDILDKEAWGEPEIPFYFDGISTTVTVERWGKHISMKNNGKVEASNGDDMSTQIMVSAMPILIHPEAGSGKLDALLVGWGSGVSASSALTFPIRSLEVVELEKSVIDASRHFSDVTVFNFSMKEFPFLVHPRLKLIANDGRNYMSSGMKKYDVIISEPSNPWITGVSNLFTVDHFRIAGKNLKEGGIFCQWVQLYEMSPSSICSIFKSFALSFSYVAVFGAEPRSTDTLMLGSMDPFRFSLKKAGGVMEEKAVKELLLEAGIEQPQDLFSGIIFGSRDEVLTFCDYAVINTDDNAFIEFSAPKDLIGFEAYQDYLPRFYAPDWDMGNVDSLIEEFGRTNVEKSENYATLALSLAKGGRKKLAGKYVVASKKQADTEMTELAVLVLSYLVSDKNEPALQFGLPVLGPEIDEETRGAFEKKYDLILKLMDGKDLEGAFKVLLELPEELWEFSDSEFQLLTAYLEYNNDRSDSASERLETVIARDDGFALERPEIYYYLAKAYYKSYNYRKAVSEMKNFVLMKLAHKLKKKLAGQ
ncbi:MAG: hypothetical protein ABIJ56_08710 [Pseudomonadota bacterium]